jgi:iron uptake system component EfeO
VKGNWARDECVLEKDKERSKMNQRFTTAIMISVLALAGCSDDAEKSDEDYAKEVTSEMHDQLLVEIKALHAAAEALQAAAPTPADRGWDADEDKTAIAKMTKAWLDARAAYERTEGAIAPIFPEIDGAIDARYEDFLEEIGDEGDQDLFDDQGVTGMHAIERILFANETSAAVIDVEESLRGYKAAAWPSTEAEAKQFKDELCQRLVDDTAQLEEEWTPQNIDIEGAYSGLIGLMNEQREKVVKAASSEEESRYANRTMADVRDNLDGTRMAYEIFKPWIVSKDGGEDIDAEIQAAFDTLDEVYGDVPGDSIPAPPATWSSENPSAADLKTPFGKLYTAVFGAVDPNEEGSAVDGMNKAAKLLGFEEFVEE